MEKLKHYLIELFLIIIGILIALGLDRCNEHNNIEHEKTRAIQSIYMELQYNLEIIEQWKKQHLDIKGSIGNYMDNFPDSILHNDFFDLSSITKHKGLINKTLSTRAWESAKSTSIINEFDYNVIKELTGTYNFQKSSVEETIDAFRTTLYDYETLNNENIQLTLKMLELLFSELINDEIILIEYYKSSIDTLASYDGKISEYGQD